MTKRIAMTSKEITLAKSVPCPKCGVWSGKSCKNTQTGEKKQVPHEKRLLLAQAGLPKVEVKVQEQPKKKNPKEKLTPEQKHVVDVILDKIDALQKHAEFVGPVSVGPIISTYRFFPLRKTRVAHLEAMWKDFAVALGEDSVLVKRMPGESAVGVFVPNKVRKEINFRDTIQNVVAYEQKHKDRFTIPLNFGQDQIGEPFVEDLTQLPHLLIAGSTGGGKSTLLHGIVTSLAWVKPSSEVKFIISDTKGVEFKDFAPLPHLMFPIAKSVYETMQYLQWCIAETQKRLDIIGARGGRNIHDYNKMVDEKDRMPFVVVVIDEIADIMGPAVENSEAKLNSKKLSAIVARARATGIHVIAGTQRPDVKMVSGAIKANFPARLTFRLPSGIDSRTVITTKGAECLMSKGDMLYYSPLSPELKRLHAPFTSLADVNAAVQFVVGRERLAEQQKQQAQNPTSVYNEQKETVQ